MDFSLSKEQKEYRKEIIHFAKENLNDSEYLEKYSKEMWEKVSEFGLLGLTIGEEYGGLGESYQTAAVAFEALGYACKNNGFIFVINNHIWVSQNVIYLYGSKELKDKYIPEMVEGKKIGAIAITEAEAGSDSFGMSTKAVEEDDCYVLNGTKMFISNGPIADVFVVFAVTETEPVKKYTAFVVERNFEGVHTGEDIEKMGLGACPTSELILENVRVSKENILGKINEGGRILTSAIEWERCYEFAPHVGVMQRIIESCLEQVRKRLMLYKIAWLKDKNRSAYMEASIFKLFVSESYISACRDAVQIFGAYGYTKEYELERELRDALACSIYSGTNEMQKNTIFKMADINYL